ncbi:molybdenum cofactor guanylyltransferase [Pokkaliibacter sp. CJK22405]|uniref:molybdenum cofactor guanylyltransferase n=1 Tax=Pokkaliibacter sp. CJK22405 TaxID=3384615 RepID=UPI0039856232
MSVTTNQQNSTLKPGSAVSAIILAGGQGSRMGGQDKGIVLWQGKALVDYVTDVVRPRVQEVIISCNRNQEFYRQRADRIVSDEGMLQALDDSSSTAYPGPLTGILAGLSIASHGRSLILPCDAPRLSEAVINTLIHHGSPVMLRQHGFPQPLFSCIPTLWYAPLYQAFVDGERRFKFVAEQLGITYLDWPDDDLALSNINTPELLNGME